MPKLPPRKLPSPVAAPAKPAAAPVRSTAVKSAKRAVKPLSNKEVALVLIVSHVQDSVDRITEGHMEIVAGKPLRGERPAKVMEMYKQRVERMLASALKLLAKRGLDDRITSFHKEPSNVAAVE